MNFEQIFLANLLNTDGFARRVLPYVKAEYFEDATNRIVFVEARDFFEQYNKLPSAKVICLELETRAGISESELKQGAELLRTFDLSEEWHVEEQWLFENAQKYCQDRAIYNAIMESIAIIDDSSGKKTKESLPSLLSDALGVSFDTSVGHNFVEDVEDRWKFYHAKEYKIPFDIDILNKITKRGVSRKTLNVVMAQTGAGKSIFLCHLASAYLMQGLNVLYVTLEMAEERIAERIDANVMNLNIDDLEVLPKDIYRGSFDKIIDKTKGKLFIKEYPAASTSVITIKSLLHELGQKKKFTPDILIVDYLNLCTSSRISNSENSYTMVKAIAEELRGLAQEQNFVCWSATQGNRGGFGNTDIDMTNTSDSIGLTFTTDLFFALIPTEELAAENKILVKQLKNRYQDEGLDGGKYKKFVLGLNKSKMKFYEVRQDEDYTGQGQITTTASAPSKSAAPFAAFKF